jgi:hypothetical protein
MVWYGMVPPQPPVSVFRSLRVVASFSTCPTLEASGGPVNQRLFEDGIDGINQTISNFDFNVYAWRLNALRSGSRPTTPAAYAASQSRASASL